MGSVAGANGSRRRRGWKVPEQKRWTASGENLMLALNSNRNA